MQVTFQNIAGKSITLEIDPNTKISEVLVLVAEKFDAKDAKLRFIYAGKNISEMQSLSEAGYESGKNIIVHIQRPPRAAPPPARPAPAPPVQVPASSPSPSASSPTASATSTSTTAAPTSSEPSPSPSVSAEQREQVINEFLSWGRTRNQIDTALRAAGDDFQLAAEMLMNGRIPANIPPPSSRSQVDSRPHNQGVLNEAFPVIQNVEFLRNFIAEDPNHNIHQIIELTRSFNPQLCEKIQEDTAPMLRMLGISAEKTPNGIAIMAPMPSQSRQMSAATRPIAELLAGFTREQQEAIGRLTELGFDPIMVIQVYNACDRNEMMAANCLASM